MISRISLPPDSRFIALTYAIHEDGNGKWQVDPVLQVARLGFSEVTVVEGGYLIRRNGWLGFRRRSDMVVALTEYIEKYGGWPHPRHMKWPSI